MKFIFNIIIAVSIIALALIVPGNLSNEMIIWGIRIPRITTAFIAGGGLAISGIIFQSIFRNDLASPYILGTSSAGSLGACLAIYFGLTHFYLPLFSFLFSLIAIFIIYSVARLKKHFNPTVLLLCGVSIGMICSSLIMLFQVLSSEQDFVSISRWLMGGLNIVGFESALLILPFVCIGFIVAYFFAGELNLLAVGENFSITRGVDIERTRKIMFITSSLITAPIVAELGPIGFVGLIVPHIVKKLVGYDHRYLIFHAFIAGGTFLVLCDFISRAVSSNGLLPIGVITSLIGAPFFLFLLR